MAANTSSAIPYYIPVNQDRNGNLEPIFISGISGTTGNFTVGGNLTVDGTSDLIGAVTAGSLSVTGNETIGGTLGVTGISNLGTLNAGNTNVTTFTGTGVGQFSSALVIAGGLVRGTTSITSGTYTPTVTSPEYIFANATSGNIIISLLGLNVGQVFTVVKSDSSANTVTLTPSGGSTNTINGSATYVLTAQYQSISIIQISATLNTWYNIPSIATNASSGTWTPSITYNSGTQATVTNNPGMWSRVDNTVTGSFRLTYSANSADRGSNITFTLPITPPSNFTTGDQVAGSITINSSTMAMIGTSVASDPGTKLGQFAANWSTSPGSNIVVAVIFQYIVQ